MSGSEENVRRLNTGRQRLEDLANIWAKWIGPWHEKDRYRELGEATLEALSHGDQLDALRSRIADLEADRDAARAGEARAVEALRKLHSAASYVAEECNEDDWTVDQQAMLNLHEALDAVDVEDPQPALDWLDQREREAAAREG